MIEKNSSLLKSFGFAFSGIKCCLKERNMKIHLVMGAIAVILGIVLKLSAVEWAVLALTIALVLALEAVNTGIEALVDLVSPDYHPLAKVAKDVSAGGVLLGAIGSVIVGCFLFIPHLYELFL